MRVAPVRPAVRPVARAAVQPAPQRKAPAPQQAPVKAQAGGKSGFFGLVKALFLNSWGALSGLLSIGNDLKEYRTDTANRTAHGIEIAGDIMNIIAWPAAFIPGGGRAIAGGLMFLGLVTKTTGEMMAGKD